jgi:hypothetical protein
LVALIPDLAAALERSARLQVPVSLLDFLVCTQPQLVFFNYITNLPFIKTLGISSTGTALRCYWSVTSADNHGPKKGARGSTNRCFCRVKLEICGHSTLWRGGLSCQ